MCLHFSRACRGQSWISKEKVQRRTSHRAQHSHGQTRNHRDFTFLPKHLWCLIIHCSPSIKQNNWIYLCSAGRLEHCLCSLKEPPRGLKSSFTNCMSWNVTQTQQSIKKKQKKTGTWFSMFISDFASPKGWHLNAAHGMDIRTASLSGMHPGAPNECLIVPADI